MNAKKRRFLVGGMLAATLVVQNAISVAAVEGAKEFNATFSSNVLKKTFTEYKIIDGSNTDVYVTGFASSYPGASVKFYASTPKLTTSPRNVTGKGDFSLVFPQKPSLSDRVTLHVESTGNVSGVGGRWTP